MKLIKVITKKTFKDNKGNTKNCSYFALENENGKLIPVKPLFDNGYELLNYQCEKIVDLRKEYVF